jgi:hypothetical protein
VFGMSESRKKLKRKNVAHLVNDTIIHTIYIIFFKIQKYIIFVRRTLLSFYHNYLSLSHFPSKVGGMQNRRGAQLKMIIPSTLCFVPNRGRILKFELSFLAQTFLAQSVETNTR